MLNFQDMVRYALQDDQNLNTKKDNSALTARKSVAYIIHPGLKTLGYIVRLLQSRGHNMNHCSSLGPLLPVGLYSIGCEN